MADEEAGDGAGGKEVEELCEALVRNIMGRLAPQALVKAQLICNEWKSIMWAQRARQGNPWFLFVATLRWGSESGFEVSNPFMPGQSLLGLGVPYKAFPHCWGYNPEQNCWFQTELPAAIDCRAYPHFYGATPGSGVVAFVERVEARHLKFEDPSLPETLWIGNPLLRTWRRVPCPHAEFTDVVVSRAGSFKVVQHRLIAVRWMQGRKDSAWGTWVFDSVTERWTKQAAIQTSAPIASQSYDDSRVGDNGLMLYLKAVYDAELGLPVAEVLTYSMEKDEWRVAAPAAPFSMLHLRGRPCCKTLRVFEHQGVVQVLAGISMPEPVLLSASGQEQTLRIFGFYRYDAKAKGWVWDQESEVQLLDHFNESEVHNMTKFDAVGGGGHVQLVCSKRNSSNSPYPPFLEVLRYEASSKRWSKAFTLSCPGCPLTRAIYNFWPERFVAFHPRLDSGSELESAQLY